MPNRRPWAGTASRLGPAIENSIAVRACGTPQLRITALAVTNLHGSNSSSSCLEISQQAMRPQGNTT
jgi:hypothetical protein